MIALAVADWPLSRRLLAEGKLHVDFLETPGFLAEHTVAQFPTQRFLLHNSIDDWSLGHPDALNQEQVLPHTLHLLNVTQAPWFSVHLGFSAATVVFEHWNMPRSAVLGREQLFAAICGNVQALAEALPVPLILENLDYCSGGAYEHICEPEFIRAVVEATGTGLLLDLAHARVSAARLGQPIERYFFRELRYQKCTALVYSFNDRSIHFHEAIGFRFEGRLRNMVYTDGQYFDEIYFGLTSAEWDEIDPPLGLQRFSVRAETAAAQD